jgi:hypothetical protein
MALNLHPKVASGMLAGYLTTVLIVECNRRGFPIDGNEGAALTGIFTILGAYLERATTAEPLVLPPELTDDMEHPPS